MVCYIKGQAGAGAGYLSSVTERVWPRSLLGMTAFAINLLRAGWMIPASLAANVCSIPRLFISSIRAVCS